MYHIVHWHAAHYLIYNDYDQHLSEVASESITAAVSDSHPSWDTKTQPERRFHVHDGYLVEDIMKHKILLSTPSVDYDYLQQHYPELLI